MKLINPLLEYLPPKFEETFFIESFDLPYFGTPWHYHIEFELVLVKEGDGKRFVGNSVSNFNSGDLSFLGSNLPHLYLNPPDYYEKDSKYRAKSIVLHFRPEAFGDLFYLPEFKKTQMLFDRAKYGMDITGKSRNQIIDKMQALLASEGLKRLIYLFEILDILSSTNECHYISEQYITGDNSVDSIRLNDVLQYILSNFQEEITLEDVAATVHMTRTSFCRFFKERTKRTFSDLVKDLWLTHASKILREENISISNAAFASGYNNLANFNRQFKERFSYTPIKYRSLYTNP